MPWPIFLFALSEHFTVSILANDTNRDCTGQYHFRNKMSKKDERKKLFHFFPVSTAPKFQPRPQGLLGGQNGGSEKTLANTGKQQVGSRSPVSKNIGDFNLCNMAEGSVSYSLVKTGNTSNWTLWSVDFIKIVILILLLSFYFPNLSL